MASPNSVAYITLLGWIPFTAAIAPRMSAQKAALVAYVGAIFFLPERISFDLPAMPSMGKEELGGIAGYLAARVADPKLFREKKPVPFTTGIAILFALSRFATVFANGEPQRFVERTIPGLRPYDGVAATLTVLLSSVLPFYLGEKLFRNWQDLRTLARALLLFGLIYVPFVLLEVRLSPFFHSKVYGFFQHDFAQMKREGGFRAIVFMAHALAVALFTSQALSLAAVSVKLKNSFVRLGGAIWIPVLAVALVACKSLGAMIYGLIGVPVVLLLSPRKQLRLARILAIVVMAYPLLRFAELVPIDWLLDQANAFDPLRGQSLAFRFTNEHLLLDHVHDKKLFGWGAWGRNRVHDPITGEDLSVVDGQWIISLSTNGLLGFFALFGALLLPIARTPKTALMLPPNSDELRCVAALAFVLALNCIDLLPNGLFHPLPFLIAGALAGIRQAPAPSSQQRATTA